MFLLYSLLLTIVSVLLLPRLVFDALTGGKYAAGLKQRLGFTPRLEPNGQPVIWLHCVSVGEANAARSLANSIRTEYPRSRLVISTTTRTGQELARTIFDGVADLVIYFPFDWRWSVRRSLKRISPSVVLLMETEIWFNFIRESNKFGARVALVNGRLSERSHRRYKYIAKFMRRILGYLDLAMMQENADASRVMALGARASKVRVTGNLKFDQHADPDEISVTELLRERFGIGPDAPLIIAASTHSPEESYILEAFKDVWKSSPDRLPRLLIAPRHPERFAEVLKLIESTGFTWAARSQAPLPADQTAEIILLDSIGELRSVYELGEIVFVGGSLIPHGGQSVFEPASAGKAILTGPHTANFTAAVTEFLSKQALIQLPVLNENDIAPALACELRKLLSDPDRASKLGQNALLVMKNNRGAVTRTLEYLSPLIRGVHAG